MGPLEQDNKNQHQKNIELDENQIKNKDVSVGKTFSWFLIALIELMIYLIIVGFILQFAWNNSAHAAFNLPRIEFSHAIWLLLVVRILLPMGTKI